MCVVQAKTECFRIISPRRCQHRKEKPGKEPQGTTQGIPSHPELTKLGQHIPSLADNNTSHAIVLVWTAGRLASYLPSILHYLAGGGTFLATISSVQAHSESLSTCNL